MDSLGFYHLLYSYTAHRGHSFFQPCSVSLHPALLLKLSVLNIDDITILFLLNHFLFASSSELVYFFLCCHQVRNVTVDGGFGVWSGWGTCSHNNGGSAGSCLCRTRACDSPAPQCGGQQCHGISVEVANCSRYPSYHPSIHLSITF